MARHDTATDPDWPTTMRARFADGRCLGVDNSVWLYRAVPMGPVSDAVSSTEMLAVAAPLYNALAALEPMARPKLARRAASRSSYREFHALLVNIPRRFVPDPNLALADLLAEQFPDRIVDQRLLLFGVKLNPSLGTGGFRAAVDSVAETLLVGGAPMSDYDQDFQYVDHALARAGLTTPTGDQFALANAWWNSGHFGDTPQLVHSDHLHIFASPHSLREAARLEKEEPDCRKWPHLSRHHTIALGTVQDFDMTMVKANDTMVHWACEFVEKGALAVSVRGRVEPAKVTRSELRRNRRRYTEDVREQEKNRTMDRSEVSEKLVDLEAVESVYADPRNAEPTVIETSIVAAFAGHNGRGSFDLDGETTRTVIASMVERQDKALTEMMLCSPLRANPFRHDESVSMVAFSGLPSLSVVGDTDGALLGFTERDRQPARISPVAASVGDALPLMLVAGETGSGKELSLSTVLPTPLGRRAIGDLRVGDEVFGRDGRPTRVSYLSPVNETPDAYRVTLSDGQQFDAGHDHQWVVSDFRDRNACRNPKRIAALERWERSQLLVARVEALAQRYAADTEPATHQQLADLLRGELGEDNPWKGHLQVRAGLVMADCPREIAIRPVTSRRRQSSMSKVDPVVLFPVAQTMRACIRRWSSVTGGNAVRWAKVTTSRLEAAEAVLAKTDEAREETIREILRMLRAEGADIPTTYTRLAGIAREEGVTSRRGHREVTIPLSDHVRHSEVFVYPTNIALKSLAVRLAQQHHNAPADGYMEQRMTTGEMLGAGVRLKGGHARFAIRVTEPIQMPDADLPVDPYVMGAWLGDGNSGDGVIASGFTEPCTDADGRTDQEFMLAELGKHYQVRTVPSNPLLILCPGMTEGLKAAGVHQDKHIPMTYLRGSADQRLALLQGLMDTDGTVNRNGACELALCNERLALDALDLIRSLGIKCRMVEGQAGYTRTDPETGEVTRRTTGTRYRMHFTTDLPAFRLPRKARRQSLTVRETQRWLDITSIEPIDPMPMRCLSVQDPDHTYLAGGYVPSSNTQALLFLASQFAAMGSPNVILDPKQGSDHSPVVLAHGGQVSSLDDLVKADGVFDPLRFSASREVAVETAAGQLLRVNPWGTSRDDYEQPLTHALSYGVSQGATCIGEALVMADDANKVPPDLVKRVMDQTASSPMFRAFVGVEPGTNALRVQDGITLIKVGDAHLDLPEPGSQGDTLPQRIALALVRMMVFGSGMALSGRRGVLHLDEAWVMLSAGRSEVEKMGRLARSQEVLPILYTQRVSDALRAELAGYISRGLILPMTDPDEAGAACALFKLEPTADRMGRITAPGTISGAADATAAPNWNSMRALRDPLSRKVLRGSIGIYKDLSGRAVPVEITLPEKFLALSSTNTADLRERRERMEKAARELREQEQWAGVDTLAKSVGSLMDADVPDPNEPAADNGVIDPLASWL